MKDYKLEVIDPNTKEVLEIIYSSFSSLKEVKKYVSKEVKVRQYANANDIVKVYELTPILTL